MPSRTESDSTEVINGAKTRGSRQHLLYYCIGEVLVRPVGLFTGKCEACAARCHSNNDTSQV